MKQFILFSFILILGSCNQTGPKTNDVNKAKTIEQKSTEIKTKLEYENIQYAYLPDALKGKKEKPRLIHWWKDAQGEHYVLYYESGETPSNDPKCKEQEETELKCVDAIIRAEAYDYDPNTKKATSKFTINDGIKACEFDAGSEWTTIEITDENQNGIAEIWSVYKQTCTSDVSPQEMKIIMYEGTTKHAMRGTSRIEMQDIKEGGTYTMDEIFKKADQSIQNFAKKLWENNKCDNCK